MWIDYSLLIDCKLSTYIKNRKKRFDEEATLQAPSRKESGFIGSLGSGRTSNKITVAMWNVNGIRSVITKKMLTPFLTQYMPDFLCLNETKINYQQYQKNPILVKGYSGYWNFCKISSGYSGVAIFTRFHPISVTQDLQEVEHSQEGRVLTLQFEHFYLVVVYVPTAGQQLERLHYKTQKYDKALGRHCQSLKKKGKGVVLCGDMNVCHQDIDMHVTPNSHKQPGFTAQQRLSFKQFLSLGWIDTFRKLHPNQRKYTWWRIQHGNRTKNIGKRLDYFLVNTDFFPAVTQSLILNDVMGSDHCPIFLKLDLSKVARSIEVFTQVCQKKVQNIQKIQCIAQKTDINSVEQEKEQAINKNEKQKNVQQTKSQILGNQLQQIEVMQNNKNSSLEQAPQRLQASLQKIEQ